MKPLPPPLTDSDLLFPMESFNDLREAVGELQARLSSMSDVAGGTPIGQSFCLVTPEEDAKAGDVLSLAGRTYPGEAHVRQTLALNAKKPAAGDMNVVVCLGAIPAGTTGLAVRSGLAWCEVDITDVSHGYVSIDDNGTPISDGGIGWAFLSDPTPNGVGHPGIGKRECLVRFPVGGGGGESMEGPLQAITVSDDGTLEAEPIDMLPDLSLPTNFIAWGPASRAKYAYIKKA